MQFTKYAVAAAFLAALSFGAAAEAKVRLTSMGLSDDGAVWRIRNEDPEVKTIRFQQVGGSFSRVYQVNPGEEILVTGPAGTAKLINVDTNRQEDVKASGSHNYTPPAPIVGAQGVQGAQGAQGAQGVQGVQGPAGADGKDADMTQVWSNRDGIAGVAALAAIQQNPHADGIQVSLGAGSWDGAAGTAFVVGTKFADSLYGNVGVISAGGKVGGAISVTYTFN
ncbi:hypothetical protein [Oceanomicrobium pacificus]|uniref:Collagen-like protein n=1 Tax=Oceanomicrobium pacificus TaxID=2692916 RepID=A0A6B0TPU7_9RHOB|nr:hypothetical protein [Oceanomicrobium pacificus]MXU65956.1 hypothetical protein [Oceanomicrobium pacificus]